MSVSASSSRRAKRTISPLCRVSRGKPGRRIVGVENHHRLRDFARIERFGQEVQQRQPGLLQVRPPADRHRHACHVQ